MKSYKQMCDSHKEIELELYEAIQEVGDAVGINTDKVPADIENNHLTIVVQHKNKTNATNYPVEIFNISGNKSIAKGTTNNNGEFNFEVPPNIEHLICNIRMDVELPPLLRSGGFLTLKARQLNRCSLGERY